MEFLPDRMRRDSLDTKTTNCQWRSHVLTAIAPTVPDYLCRCGRSCKLLLQKLGLCVKIQSFSLNTYRGWKSSLMFVWENV